MLTNTCVNKTPQVNVLCFALRETYPFVLINVLESSLPIGNNWKDYLSASKGRSKPVITSALVVESNLHGGSALEGRLL